MASVTRWLVGTTVLLAACANELPQGVTPTETAAPVALFQPDATDPCLSVMPFPTDLVRDPVTHRMNIPYCTTDDATTVAIKTGLRTLDGYSINSPVYVRLSKAIDESTIAGNVKLLKAEDGSEVTVTPIFAANASDIDPANDNTLYIHPPTPGTGHLAESTQYIAVVTDGVKGTDGLPVLADQVFGFLKSKEPLIDDTLHSRYASLEDADANALEPLRLYYKSVFETLEAAGITRDRVAAAWPFTTQTVHATLAPLAALVTQSTAVPTVVSSSNAATHPLLVAAGIPTSKLCKVVSGRVSLTSLLTDSGTFGVDASGNPVTSTISVDYLLTTPLEGSSCADWSGAKVVVFAHGLGRCKNDALALANTLGAAGYATLSFDGPRAGARSVTGLGDQDLDGCADQPATPEIIALPGETANPFAIRDEMREWALELVQEVAVAKAGALAFAGLTGTATTTVGVIGHSFGGMAAVLGMSVSSVQPALAVSAASADFGSIFEPSLRENVLAQAPAGTPDSIIDAKTQESVTTFRWVLEPADPYFAAEALPAPAAPATKKALAQVVSAGSTGTGPADAPLHATATQELLATALGESLAEITFTMTYDPGTGATGICDSDTAIVGAPLVPCIEDDTAALYQVALAKTAGMQRQLTTFVASQNALVCSPDYTVACP